MEGSGTEMMLRMTVTRPEQCHHGSSLLVSSNPTAQSALEFKNRWVWGSPQHLKPDPESQGVAENVMSGLISNTPAQSSPQAYTALGTHSLREQIIREDPLEEHALSTESEIHSSRNVNA